MIIVKRYSTLLFLKTLVKICKRLLFMKEGEIFEEPPG
nr:MAG TPA: hypothetical protein [Caudoviricetes sp.]